MATEVLVKRTPWTKRELLAAFRTAWLQVFGSEPSRACLALLWGQACLETGREGSGCYGHNISNIMGVGPEGLYHVLRKAPECALNLEQADKLGTPLANTHVACKPGQVPYLPDGGSKFRAYSTLLIACIDKLEVLNRIWPRAIIALAAAQGPADAHSFVAGLVGPPRYFTADEIKYLWDDRSLAAECLRTTTEADWAFVFGDNAPDTEPGTPTAKSSQSLKAQKEHIADISGGQSVAPTLEGEHTPRLRDQ